MNSFLKMLCVLLVLLFISHAYADNSSSFLTMTDEEAQEYRNTFAAIIQPEHSQKAIHNQCYDLLTPMLRDKEGQQFHAEGFAKVAELLYLFGQVLLEKHGQAPVNLDKEIYAYEQLLTYDNPPYGEITIRLRPEGVNLFPWNITVKAQKAFVEKYRAYFSEIVFRERGRRHYLKMNREHYFKPVKYFIAEVKRKEGLDIRGNSSWIHVWPKSVLYQAWAKKEAMADVIRQQCYQLQFVDKNNPWQQMLYETWLLIDQFAYIPSLLRKHHFAFDKTMFEAILKNDNEINSDVISHFAENGVLLTEHCVLSRFADARRGKIYFQLDDEREPFYLIVREHWVEVYQVFKR